MNKSKINYFIDLVAALFFLICAGIGVDNAFLSSRRHKAWWHARIFRFK